jgi:hypothetical protein
VATGASSARSAGATKIAVGRITKAKDIMTRDTMTMAMVDVDTAAVFRGETNSSIPPA